jgi:hypothetical protein
VLVFIKKNYLMKINLAHLREKSISGGWIDFAVFDAKSSSGTNSDNDTLLHQLTVKARASGLKVEQSALAYKQGGHIRLKTLVDCLMVV